MSGEATITRFNEVSFLRPKVYNFLSVKSYTKMKNSAFSFLYLPVEKTSIRTNFTPG